MWILAMTAAQLAVAQFGGSCEALDVAMVADVNAPTSLDALDGPAPWNLVVLRDIDAGFVVATVDDPDDDAPARDAPNTSRGLGQRFDVGPLVPGRRGVLELIDPSFDVTSPDAPRRAIPFTVGAQDDVERPRILGEPDAVHETLPGGLQQDGCGGPLPSWRADEHVTTVEVPDAEDDIGVAAFELRVTLDGLETVADLRIAGAGGGPLVARTFDRSPERLRVVALDHAGNPSEAVEVEVAEDGGCAQARASSPAGALVVLIALRRRRSRRFVRSDV